MLVIQELLDDAAPQDRGLLTFYSGETYRRRDQAGDRAKAAELYAKAVTMPNAPAAAWREHGFALAKQGHVADARAAFQRYLADAPQAEDRAFVQRELEKLGGSQ